MSRSTQLLALSFYYPPANNPRAVQVARLLGHSHASTVLVCADYHPTDDRTDPLQSPLAEDSLQKCLRVPFSQPAWKSASARVANKAGILLWDKTPDRYRDWKPAVMKALSDLRTAGQFNPDVLVTFGSPMSDHLIGLEISRKYRLPWIAHFSDPWVENPFKDHSWFTKAVNLSLERKVAEAANLLIFTSDETVELVMSKYSNKLRAKARVLPHAYEEKLYERQADNGSRITIRHVGDLYGRRTPAPLFRALERIVSTNPDLLSNVCFELVGSTYDLKLNDMGLDKLPAGLVAFRPTVSYLESLLLMTSADGLLVIDAPAALSVFLPSKLIDYIGAGRPILGITPPGAASNLISELGGWVTDPTDALGTEKAVSSFVSLLRDSSKDVRECWGQPQVRKRFEGATVAKKFEEMIDEVQSR